MKPTTDKSFHFIVSLLLAALLGCLWALFPLHWAWCMVAAWVITMMIGVIKEILDLYIGGSGFDLHDIFADAAGATIGCTTALLNLLIT